MGAVGIRAAVRFATGRLPVTCVARLMLAVVQTMAVPPALDVQKLLEVSVPTLGSSSVSAPDAAMLIHGWNCRIERWRNRSCRSCALRCQAGLVQAAKAGEAGQKDRARNGSVIRRMSGLIISDKRAPPAGSGRTRCSDLDNDEE